MRGNKYRMNDEPEPYNDQEEPDYATDDDDEFENNLRFTVREMVRKSSQEAASMQI